jgi:hypothetical protein
MPRKFSPQRFHTAEAIAAREAAVAQYHATFRWHSLKELWPLNRALVRMADGRVVGASPRADGTWDHSPHEQWGEPVAFALQQPWHSTSGPEPAGTAVRD